MSYVVICLLSLVAGVVFYWKVIARRIAINAELSKIPKLPVPTYPLIGHSLSLSRFDNFFKTLVGFFHELAASKAKWGMIYVGQRPWLWAIHPDTVELLLKSSKNLSKATSYNYLRCLIKGGLVVSTGKKWQQRRKMITPTFHYDILKDFLDVMNEYTSELVDYIQQDIASGREVDVKQHLKLCALDIICETAMGCKVGAQANEDNEYVKAIRKFGGLLFARRFNPLYQYDFIFNHTSVGKDHNKTLKIIHEYSRRVIDQKMAALPGLSSKPPKRKAFLDMLIAAQTEDGGSLLADDIQEEVDTFMFAGHDTTAVALMWGIFVLGHYPGEQKKMQEELDLVFAGDQTCDVTFDHIKDLHYLDLVVKEILRLYPSAGIIGRKLDEECVVNGVTLPKGLDFSAFIYFIHRHPDIWEEPNKFIPERFETETRLKNKQSPYSYIPFSAGPRNCIGQRYAIQEMKVILAKFFRRFSVVSYTPEDDIKIELGVVMETIDKLEIKVTERTV